MAGKFVKDVLIQRLEVQLGLLVGTPLAYTVEFYSVKVRIRFKAFYDPGVRTFPNGDPGYPPSGEMEEYEVQVLEGSYENSPIDEGQKVIIADWLEDGNLPDDVYEQCMSVVSEMDEPKELTQEETDKLFDDTMKNGGPFFEESGEGNLPDQDYPW